MSLEEITQALRRWDDHKNDPEYLKQLLSPNDCFDFSFKEINHSEKESIHAYPGVLDNQIVLFVIHADRDTKEQASSPEGILPHIDVLRKLNGGEDDLIPDEVAERRIQDWQQHHEDWIADVTATNNGVYSAYSIPANGMGQDRQYRMYFALKPSKNGSEVTNFDADLVIWDFEENVLILPKKEIDFFDTVRLVPPFEPAESFLLKSVTRG